MLHSFFACSESQVSSKKHTLATGLKNSPLDVFSLMTLTRPSFPGKVCITLAVCHFPRGAPLSTISTRSPCFRFLASLFHFRRKDNQGKYCLLHCLQNWFVINWIRLHLLRLQLSASSNIPGARFGFDLPMRKWLGVSGSKSCILSLTAVRGLLLTMLSTSLNTVSSCRSDSLESFRIVRRGTLTH